MRLSDCARIQGVHYQTAWKWAHEGKMPIPVIKTETGRYLVLTEASVSGAGVFRPLVASEVGSALNGARPKLKRLLVDPDVSVIVVEHRHRLARFGVEYIQAALLEAALSVQGRTVRAMDTREVEDDLVRDRTDVYTSFCARLYGKRAAHDRAKNAIAAATGSDS